MKYFLARMLFTSIAVLFVAWLLPGIQIRNGLALFLAVIILGLLNAVIRPLMIFLTLPITVLTFGLFLFVINGAILYLTSLLVKGFEVQNLFIAMVASILISIFSSLINWLARG